MTRWNILGAGLLCLALVFTLTACGDDDATGSGDSPVTPELGWTQESGEPTPALADVAGPGVDFARINLGLKPHTLELLGNNVGGMCGAKGGRKIFFATTDEGVSHVYSRDLAEGTRTLLTEPRLLQPGSLGCDEAGRYLVYSRLRKLDGYLDDPLVTIPEYLSVVERYDTDSGDTMEVFNFRRPELQAYRADYHGAMLSRDGQRIVVMAYAYDDLLLRLWLNRWLPIAADYLDRQAEMDEEELTYVESYLHEVLSESLVARRLAASGANVSGSGEIGERENEAVKELYNEVVDPKAALLLWEDGETRVLPLSLDPEMSGFIHNVAYVGNQSVLLRVDDMPNNPATDHHFYKVNLETGATEKVCSFAGAISLIELNRAETELAVFDNPIDFTTMSILPETRLTYYNLADGSSEATELPTDFLGYAGCTTDLKYVFGQSADNNNVYSLEIATGKMTMLNQLISEISAIFVTGEGEDVVYMDQGVLYHLKSSAEPQDSAEWIADEYFTQFRPKIEGFCTQLGFDVPADLGFEWQEREGLGAHEISGIMHNPAFPDSPGFFRYDLQNDHMTSIWFPNGYCFTADDLAPGELEYEEAEEWAGKVLQRIGWLNPETRSIHHPTGEPAYAPQSGVYLLLFRDGFNLPIDRHLEWIFNADATVTVNAADGTIQELSMSTREQVLNQPLALNDDELGFSIRTRGDHPIPPNAPMRIDLENKRLLVTHLREDSVDGGVYSINLLNRICYEVDTYIQPEDALIFTTLVDTETGAVLGQQNFVPESVLLEYLENR